METMINTNVDTNTFRPYDSAQAVPDIKGFRTVKVIYRQNSKGEKAGETSFIRVPDYITEQQVADNMDALMPYIIGFLQSQEDEIIKDKHKEGAKGISPDSLNLAAIIAKMEESQTASRLSAEKIGEWFADNMRDKLALAFHNKLGMGDDPTPAELEKLLAIVGAYEGKLKSLASPKTSYREEEVKLLVTALEITGAKDTFLGQKFIARLEGMKKQEADLLALL